jgi:DNA-binding XRE family transcriptional regulator
MELKLLGLKLVLAGRESMSNQKIKYDERNTIGKNIREARQKIDIGQTELVSRLQLLDVKMTRETLVKIERGVQHIQLEQLKAIKTVLGVSYEDLLD